LEPSEREKQLRRQFGPAPGPTPTPAPPRRWARPPLRLIGAAASLLALAGLGASFLALTPHEHVAPGCWWWTARTLAEVVPGQRGCLRAYVATGGALSEGVEPSAFTLPFAYADPDRPPLRSPCPFVHGDAAVVRYHAVFDDGRVIVVVEDCR
jgi:hypothetical protein